MALADATTRSCQDHSPHFFANRTFNYTNGLLLDACGCLNSHCARPIQYNSDCLTKTEKISKTREEEERGRQVKLTRWHIITLWGWWRTTSTNNDQQWPTLLIHCTSPPCSKSMLANISFWLLPICLGTLLTQWGRGSTVIAQMVPNWMKGVRLWRQLVNGKDPNTFTIGSQ